jgi:polyphenol oxidase
MLLAAHLHHGNTVAVFRRDQPDTWPVRTVPVRAGSNRTMRVFSADGVVSDAPGLYFFMTFADCVPLVFVDPTRGVIGAAHAGWRGTALGIGPAVVRAMNAAFGSNPSDIVTGIGPSIGPCCYPVQSSVRDAFASNGLEPVAAADGDGVTRLDLWASNSQQLQDCGVPLGSIEHSDICTSCNLDTYFSHRAEGGRTGRFGLGMGIDSGSR